MKLKKIFALALAVCMMVSVMPTTLAVDGVLTSGGTSGSGDGVLTSGGGSSSLTLTSGGSTVSRVTSGSAQTRQDGVLYSTGSGSEGGTTPVADPVVDTSGALDQGGSGTEAVAGPMSWTQTVENTTPSRTDADGLVTSKTVTPNGDKYTVTIEAYSTGTVTDIEVAVPTDIVLVLDESSGMSEETYYYEEVYGTTEQLRAAGDTYYVYDEQSKSYLQLSYCNNRHLATSSGWITGAGWYSGSHFNLIFLPFHWGYLYYPMESETDTGSTTTDGGNTLKHVQFYELKHYKNTSKLGELQTAAKGFVQQVYDQADTNDVDHRVSVVTFGSTSDTDVALGESILNNKVTVDKAITDMAVDITEGVDLDGALALATAELADVEESHNKVVVVFTCVEELSKTDANSAISNANVLKSNKATVITVGMMTLADPTLDVTDTKNIDFDEASALVNATMQGVSSNFPAASAYNNLGNKDSSSFYLTAANSTQLSNIFEIVKDQLSSTTGDLDATTQIKDTVEKYFVAPATISSVTVETVEASSYTESTGVAVWDESTRSTLTNANIRISGQAITVSGFAFDQYFLSQNAKQNSSAPHGSKVVVKFDFSVKEGFFGGDGVPTNTADSGVCTKDGAVVENFTYPRVDIPVAQIEVEAESKNIYLSNTLSNEQLVNGAAVTIGGVAVDLSKTDLGLGTDSWKADYLSKVQLTVNSDWADTTEDGTFTITGTVTGGTSKSDTSEAANIKVFKPVITFEDSTIYLGEKADYSENNGSPLVVWKNGQTSSDDAGVTMTGNKPSVDVDYSIEKQEELYFTGCTDISITKVSLNEDDKDYKANTTFWNGDEKTDDVQFTVHVVKPEFETSNATIYLSNEINLNDLMQVKEDWVCDSECNDEQSLKNADVPNTITIDHSFSVNDEAVADELAPEDCATYTVTTTVNRLHVQSNAQVKVHVVKPEITNADTAIYLGNTVDLNTLVTEEGDTWTCDETGEDRVSLDINNAEGARIAPDVDHSFNDTAVITAETRYQPETCTPVTFTTTVTSDVSKDTTPEDNTFTVHVHVPQFTVTAQDLWADFNDTVYLYNNTDNDAIVSPVNTWVDREGHSNALEVSGDKAVVITDILFSKADPYTMGETDVDVDVIKVQSTVNDVAYTAVKADSTENYDKQLTVVKAVAEEDHDFTIHINKFKAVISNNGEQNAIYTLSNGTKVAVPAKGSVTVAGLICGKEYTISETVDNAWTWRYGDAASANYGDDKENISCVVGVKSEATNSSVDVSMNYGAQSNAKWLAGEDCVVNKLNANGEAVALPAKKEEEVNA